MTIDDVLSSPEPMSNNYILRWQRKARTM